MRDFMLSAAMTVMIVIAGALAMVAGYGTAAADDCSVTVGDITVDVGSCVFGDGTFSATGIFGSVGG